MTSQEKPDRERCTIWTGEELAIPEEGSSTKRGMEGAGSTARGGEQGGDPGRAGAGAAWWGGRGERTEVGPWGFTVDGPVTWAGFLLVCSF